MTQTKSQKFRKGDLVLIEARVGSTYGGKTYVEPINKTSNQWGGVAYFIKPDKTTLVKGHIQSGDKFQRLRDGEIISVFGLDGDTVVYSIDKAYHSMHRDLFLNAFILVD